MNSPSVVFVEKLDGNTVLGFSDGSTTVISTAVLEAVMFGDRKHEGNPLEANGSPSKSLGFVGGIAVWSALILVGV